jgi:P-type E1-E2 ATPase
MTHGRTHAFAGLRPGITIEVPGRRALRLRHLVIDFNGTLAASGKLLPGVRHRLAALSASVEITVLTADTFGTARTALRKLPVAVQAVVTGLEKKRFVAARRRQGVVPIGNGNNDVEMLECADLGIAVLGPEGMSPALLAQAKVLTASIQDALDLLLDPRRLVATLRR